MYMLLCYYIQAPSIRTLQQQVRISLKNLESLTYNLTDSARLEEVLKLTTQLEQTVKTMVPTLSGLLLRPSTLSRCTITARKIKLKYKKTAQWKCAQAYSSLPKMRKRGRPKTQRLRKKKVTEIQVYIYILNINYMTDCG